MKSATLLFTAASLFTVCALPLSAQDSKAKKKTAEEKTAPEKKAEGTEEKPAKTEESELTKEQSILKQALENQAKLPGYSVDVVLKTPGGNATLKGALGTGSLSLDCTDVKGVKKKRVVVFGGEFYLSEDAGKTWKKGDDADKQSTLLFNNIITAPVQMKDGLIKEGGLTIKAEKLDGEEVVHIEKPAKGKAAAVHFWIARESKLKDAIFVRKAELVVAGDDIELLATITYSKLAEPVEIKAPEAK